nr:hypothetical protein [Candidatus Neomarinimicrobiota bacterium]
NDIDKDDLTALSKSIKKQISDIKIEIDDLQYKMKSKHQHDGFVDWIKKRQHKIKNMSKITNVDEKIKYVKEFVNRVEMNHNKETNKFVVSIILNLPLFNDKLVWKNKKDKSKGYDIHEGDLKKKIELEVKIGRRSKDSLSGKSFVFSGQKKRGKFLPSYEQDLKKKDKTPHIITNPSQ